MGKLVRAAKAGWKWIKNHPVYTAVALLVAFIGFYGTLSGGVHAIVEDSQLILGKKAEPPPEPVYQLDLINVYGAIHDAPPDVAAPGVKKVVAMGAIVANHDDTVSVTVGRNTSSLGVQLPGKQSRELELPDAVDSKPLGRGLALQIPVALVPVKDGAAELIGRIDWVIKFGPTEKDMTRELPVKGVVSLTTMDGKPIFTFDPDGDSAQPSGMKRGIQFAEPIKVEELDWPFD